MLPFIIRAGFTDLGGLAALIFAFRGLPWVHLRYGSPLRVRGASTGRLLDALARVATCVTGISHGELLSVHKRESGLPDAPDYADEQRIGADKRDQLLPLAAYLRRSAVHLRNPRQKNEPDRSRRRRAKIPKFPEEPNTARQYRQYCQVARRAPLRFRGRPLTATVASHVASFASMRYV